LGTDVALTQSFQERVFAKIRDEIGTLLTDAELKAITEAALERALFAPRETLGTYGHVERREAWLLENVRALLAQKVSVGVDVWLKENGDRVDAAIDEAIGKGMYGLIVQHLENKVSGPLCLFRDALREKGVLL
jgi:hypothetical protein